MSEGALPGGAGDAARHRDIGVRFLFALVLTVPLIVVASLGETHITDSTIAPLSRRWIEFVLAAPVVVWAAAPFFARALRGLTLGHASPFTPLAFGIFVLFAFSTVSLVAPSYIPMELHRYDGPTPLFFDTVALAVTLLLGSELVQLWARARLAHGHTGFATPLHLQTVADNIVNWLAPLAVIVGLAAYVYWAEYAPAPSMWIGIHTAMAVWIAASLCMFALAAPFAELVAVEMGVREGIDVRDACALEAFANADALVLDGALVLEPGSTTLKAHTRDHLSKLCENGLTVTLVGGQSDDVARAIALDAALQNFAAAAPDAAAERARLLEAKGHAVAVAAQTPGGATIAMPGDAAAAIVLEHDGLVGIIRARRLARAMTRNAKQGIVISAFYNLLAVAAAAGMLLLYNGWALTLVPAAIATALSPFLVIANTLRLWRVQL